MGILEKLFGTSSEKELKRIQPIVDKVLSLENEYSKFSDEKLQNQTNVFKNRLENGEKLDDILPEAFATCREAAWRVLGMKHFPVQIQGGVILHQGRIAEQKTGEGKTLVSTLPVYLNALSGNGVFVITVNDYLAKRDSVWMGKVYSYLGLTTGLIIHSIPPEERKKQYNCDITYGTNNEIGFDYLRDNMAYSLDSMVQRGFYYGIIDEVDSVLIDEARTPLIISGFSNETDEGYKKANEFIKQLNGKIVVEIDNGTKLEQASAQIRGVEVEEAFSEYDYVVEEKKKTVMLTDNGVRKAEEFYELSNLADSENIEINHYITRSLKAYGIFKKDRDYVVKENKVVIVDESTGRLMDGRRYSEGIHQAIEAKENVDIQKESKTLASITFQNLFRKFKKLSGMTGTAKTESEELMAIYNLDVVEIPTNKPIKRIDKPDKVYIKRKAKLNAILKTVEDCYKRGQPVLVGTASVGSSEELSDLFTENHIPHKVLNAKYHEQEAYIIAQAGQLNSVTIATNMAGRGTDIILGGNPEYWVLEELRKAGYSEYLIEEATSHSITNDAEVLGIRQLYKEKEEKIEKELSLQVEKIKDLGGLYIIGSERHESRRIDNQLRGRAGRQGDVGVSEFMLSLEDDLLRLFGSNKLVDMCKVLNIPDNVPIDMGILSNNIEKAQHRIESNYYAIRKQVLEYDEIIAKQRDIVYDERYRVLSNTNLKEKVVEIMHSVVKDRLNSIEAPKKYLTVSAYNEVKELFTENECIVFENLSSNIIEELTLEDIEEKIILQVDEKFKDLCNTSNSEFIQDFSRKLLLFLLDSSWQSHLVDLDELKKGVGLHALSQKNPLEVFKFESFEMFDALNNYIKNEVLNTFMGLYITQVSEKESV